ncbi:MAG: ATP-binding protein [Candidatus Parabeggiatoa sp. nov. 2]|nr:MAG: ATP-binding protein [Beggiatoa sp. 4572_84]RKZ55312.1 MAG: ATP-binding protein [Gammaproteobacteria bacterium]
MVQIFGEFSDSPTNTHEYLTMGFSPNSIPLQQRWRNNGLSADFLADYLTNFFPYSDDNDPPSIERREEIKGAVSYIANELLENAMKFNENTSQYPVSLQFQLHDDHLILRATNSLPKKNVEGFQLFIQELLNSNPDELYVRQMVRARENDSNRSSGLGLLTMKDDYKAKLGWKFETVQQNPGVVVVTTAVQLSVISEQFFSDLL